MIATVHAGHPLGGALPAPPSKSMAHRAVLCAALAEGCSHISNLTLSQDISATLAAAGQLCADVQLEPGGATVCGRGKFGPLSAPLDCCESGSTLRFLIPLASLMGQPVRFVGRGRLMERPQGVYEEIFRRQGLPFAQGPQGLSLCGPLRPGRFEAAGNVSSQFVSGLLFALPLLEEDSTLELLPPVESRSYIEMTRAAQAAFGVQSFWQGENTLYIPGKQRYLPCDYRVEGDYSQAAFLAVLGALAGGVTVTGLIDETLQGDAVILEILRRCGAQFERTAEGLVFARSELHGIEIDLADCPDLGPILMVLGLFCEGETIIRNAGRLRLKESDRIAAMEQELRRCGGKISSEGDTITIQKSALHAPGQLLEGHNDHRVVMSLSVLALAAGLTVSIQGAQAIQKSWPEFFAALRQLGAEVSEQDG